MGNTILVPGRISSIIRPGQEATITTVLKQNEGTLLLNVFASSTITLNCFQMFFFLFFIGDF